MRPVSASPTSGKPDSLTPAAPSASSGSTIDERRRSYQSYANGIAGFGGGGIVTTSAPQKKKLEGMLSAAAPKPAPLEATGSSAGPVPQPGQVAGVPILQQGGGPVTDYAAPVPLPASASHPHVQETVSPLAEPDKGVIVPVAPTPAQPVRIPNEPKPAQSTETAKPQP